MKDQLYLRVFTKNRSIKRVCMDWVDKPQNYKGLYGILQLLRGSHLNIFLLKTLKLNWVAFHSVTLFPLKCLDFQSNQYNKTRPSPLMFLQWAIASNWYKNNMLRYLSVSNLSVLISKQCLESEALGKL